MRICFAVVFFCFFLFFLFFSVHQNCETNVLGIFSGTAERIFMKLLPNDRGGNVV